MHTTSDSFWTREIPVVGFPRHAQAPGARDRSSGASGAGDGDSPPGATGVATNNSMVAQLPDATLSAGVAIAKDFVNQLTRDLGPGHLAR